MRISFWNLFFALVLGLTSCKTDKKPEDTESERSKSVGTVSTEKKMDKADSLVARTIEAHGGKRYDTAQYAFSFRKKRYTFRNSGGRSLYSVRTGAGDTLDVLDNGKLTRTIDGTATELSNKDVAKYSEALNSVIYFATLPHKLNDRAVNKSYKGRTKIKDREYDVVGVTFDAEGGGADHQDEFRYWIDTSNHTVDYLAYNYETNDGGVRFRSAYNARTVEGIRFQDYVNYEAPIGTPLDSLPALYEAGELKELSRIETEEVEVL